MESLLTNTDFLMPYNLYNKNQNTTDVLYCGKILLYRNDWQLKFACQHCEMELGTLLDLLRHTFTNHFSDLCLEKLKHSLIAATANIASECFNDDIKQEEVNAVDKVELVNELDPMQFADTYNSSCDSTKNDAQVNGLEEQENTTLVKNETPSLQDDTPFEFLDVTDQTKMLSKPTKPAKTTKIPKTPVKGMKTSKIGTRITRKTAAKEQAQGDTTMATTGNSPTVDWSCKVCNLQFDDQAALKLHRKSHKQKQLACEQCGAPFCDQTSLDEHEKQHTEEKPHRCTVCDKTFVQLTWLRKHMRTHTNAEKCKCIECGRTFASARKLVSHRRRHSNERPYLCNVCGKNFYDYRHLHSHMAMHSAARPHVCTQCNASFARRKGLKQHMLVHAEVKKYSCKYCGKAFAQHSGMYAHEKTVHAKDREQQAAK